MRIVYIPSLNISLVFFNKSASSIFVAWIENLLNYLKIEYNFLPDMRDEKYIDFIKSNIIDTESKIYMFVRNPLERLVTSFYWNYTFDIKSKDNQYPVDEFIEYANDIENILSVTTDMHILPQSWELTKISNQINKRESSIDDFKVFKYNKRFFQKNQIVSIQIEKFIKNFEALSKLAASLSHYPHYKKYNELGDNVYFLKTFGVISELWEGKTNAEKLYSIILFHFIESQFKFLPHHNNLYKGMISRLDKTKEGVMALNKLNEVINNESEWLGYDNSLILNTMRFK